MKLTTLGPCPCAGIRHELRLQLGLPAAAAPPSSATDLFATLSFQVPLQSESKKKIGIRGPIY
eukprot:3185817-Amphidinium_carterae.1